MSTFHLDVAEQWRGGDEDRSVNKQVSKITAGCLSGSPTLDSVSVNKQVRAEEATLSWVKCILW